MSMKCFFTVFFLSVFLTVGCSSEKATADAKRVESLGMFPLTNGCIWLYAKPAAFKKANYRIVFTSDELGIAKFCNEVAEGAFHNSTIADLEEALDKYHSEKADDKVGAKKTTYLLLSPRVTRNVFSVNDPVLGGFFSPSKAIVITKLSKSSTGQVEYTELTPVELKDLNAKSKVKLVTKSSGVFGFNLGTIKARNYGYALKTNTPAKALIVGNTEFLIDKEEHHGHINKPDHFIQLYSSGIGLIATLEPSTDSDSKITGLNMSLLESDYDPGNACKLTNRLVYYRLNVDSKNKLVYAVRDSELLNTVQEQQDHKKGQRIIRDSQPKSMDDKE